MTAVMSHPDQKPDQADQHTATLLNPLRTPTISADLLPMEVFQSRRARRIGRYAGFALVVFAAVLAVWFGFEVVRTNAEQKERDEVRDGVRNIKSQQERFDGLVATQSQAATIKAQLATLMANDMLWSKLTGAVVGAAPDDVDVTGLTAGVPAAGAAPAASTHLIGPPTVKIIGTSTINGVGRTKNAIASYVDALDDVPGLANAFLSSAVQGENGFEFTVRVDLTTAALENRYKPSASAGAGQ